MPAFACLFTTMSLRLLIADDEPPLRDWLRRQLAEVAPDLLVVAEATGPVCHTGNRTCFFEELTGKNVKPACPPG